MILNTRPAAAKDFPAIARLLNTAYAKAGVDLRESPASIDKRASVALVIVTELLGTIAATMTLAAPGTKYGSLASKGQMEASRLAVDPYFQGRGVGRAMLKAVIDACQTQGVQALVGVSLETMTPAHRLYETSGAKSTVIPGAKARGYTLHLTTSNEPE